MSLQFEQYTNHPVVHIDTCKVAAWNHAVITAINVFQSVWAPINAHFTSKMCFFSDVKALWVPCILD